MNPLREFNIELIDKYNNISLADALSIKKSPQYIFRGDLKNS